MTNGQKLRAKADEMGIPLRTRAQVEEALNEAETGADKAAFSRLMLRHGRLTDDAREFVRGVVAQ